MQFKLIQVSMGAIVILGLIGAILIFYLSMHKPGQIDFFFRGARYDEIVKAIKSFPLPNGATQSFRVDKDFSPSSLTQSPHETGAYRSSRGHVNVERNQKGDYFIELITVDNGHYGFAGYIFCDQPLADNELPPQPTREPGHIYKKLNNHWSAFYNY